MAVNATVYYKWSWVWSDDRRVITESNIKFLQEAECRKDAERCLPSYDVCGSGPEAELIIAAFNARDKRIQPDAAAAANDENSTYYKWKWVFGGKEVMTESGIKFPREDECRKDGNDVCQAVT